HSHPRDLHPFPTRRSSDLIARRLLEHGIDEYGLARVAIGEQIGIGRRLRIEELAEYQHGQSPGVGGQGCDDAAHPAKMTIPQAVPGLYSSQFHTTRGGGLPTVENFTPGTALIGGLMIGCASLMLWLFD